MSLGHDLALIWLAASLLLLGAVSLVACRLGERSRRTWLQRGARAVFCLVFGLVAASTVLLIAMQHGHWILTGGTMMAMVVGGTLDCGSWNERRSF